MFGLFLMYAGIGLLFMAISVPMINRRVKRNPWYVPDTKNAIQRPYLVRG